MENKKNAHGGKREGAGRKAVYSSGDKLKIRGLKFSDSEWDFIKSIAESRNTTIKGVILQSVGYTA